MTEAPAADTAHVAASFSAFVRSEGFALLAPRCARTNVRRVAARSSHSGTIAGCAASNSPSG